MKVDQLRLGAYSWCVQCGEECSSTCGDECSSTCGDECSSTCGDECSSTCGDECSSVYVVTSVQVQVFKYMW